MKNLVYDTNSDSLYLSSIRLPLRIADTGVVFNPQNYRIYIFGGQNMNGAKNNVWYTNVISSLTNTPTNQPSLLPTANPSQNPTIS